MHVRVRLLEQAVRRPLAHVELVVDGEGSQCSLEIATFVRHALGILANWTQRLHQVEHLTDLPGLLDQLAALLSQGQLGPGCRLASVLVLRLLLMNRAVLVSVVLAARVLGKDMLDRGCWRL